MKSYEAIGNPAEADCIFGHSFGTSTDSDSVNRQLADYMLEYADGRPLIADRNLVDAMPNGDKKVAYVIEGQVTTIVADERKVVVEGLGTYGAWRQGLEYMQGKGLSRPLVVAQAWHVDRAVKQGYKLGIQSIVPEGLPTDFDPQSEQIWTRSALLWVLFNALGSIRLKMRGEL